MSSSSTNPVISLENVDVHFQKSTLFGLGRSDTVRAVDDVSLDIAENDVVALVGESGCGKTTLGKAVIGLQRPTAGRVLYRGQDVWATKDRFGPLARWRNSGDDTVSYKQIRRSLQIIHQDPGGSLNSNYTVESTLSDPLKRWYSDLSGDDRRARIRGLLEYVGMTPADDYASRYPHQLSGGEKQRVALLRALLMNPDMILADEAISALDVSLRVGMMDLMLDLQDQFETSFLFVSHDLSNARYLAKKAGGRIGIMYLGQLVEIGTVDQIIENPQHPYTQVLVWATPDLADRSDIGEPPVRGIDIPDSANPPSGCRFHTRCPAIIPPEGMDIEQETYNEVVDFRLAIEDRTLDTERAWEDLGVDPTVGEDDRPADEFATTLREREFDATLPESHREPITEAGRLLADDEWAEATELLRERYESRCERDEPPLYETEGQPVACHLYDDTGERTE